METVSDQNLLKELEGGEIQKPPSYARAPKSALSVAPAEFSTLAKAAFVDNPQDKIRIFAGDRFPNDPQAINRYDILDGEVVFADDDGTLHREEPPGASGWLKSFLADAVGKGLPVAGGVVGGIGGALAGLPTLGLASGPAAVTGAMTLAGGGEAARKLIANQFLGEEQTPKGNFGPIAKEMMFAGGGEAVGFGVAKGLESARLARDFARYDPQKTKALIDTAKQRKIDLNPAQATNLTSLKSRHDLLANNPYSSDIIEEGLQTQAKQANAAGYGFLDDISDIKSARIAGSKGKEAASEIIGLMRKERSNRARPFYEKAFSYEATTSPELAALADRPSMREALAVAKKLAADDGLDLSDPMNTVQGLHFVKMAFDTMLKEPPRSGVESFSRKAVAEMRGKVYDFLNKATEGHYGAANRVYSAWSTDVDRVGEGLIAGVADVNDRGLNKAARILFSTDVDASDVAWARKLFAKNNRTDEWNALMRSYLQDSFEQAGREYATTGGMKAQAPKFRAAMMGNPKQAAILKNAMTLEQWEAFDGLMEVFEALGRTPGRGGSQTYARGAEEAAMRRESGSGAIGQVAQTVLSPQTIGTRAGQFLSDVRMGKYAEEMARVMTSPDAMKKLRQLRKMNPNDEKFIAGVSALLGGVSSQVLQ